MISGDCFTWRARVRFYECDSLGHVNNAVYLYYLQQATLEACAYSGAGAWTLRSLVIEYLAPAFGGDDLVTRVCPTAVEKGSLTCNYDILRERDGRTALRARATWAASGAEPCRLGFLKPATVAGPAPLRLSAERLDAHRYYWKHTVCSYELDGSGFANPAQLLRWVEEAKFVACSEVGWPLEHMLASDLMIVQIRHDSEFCVPLLAGERVEVVSRICDLRLLKGTWSHEIYRLNPAVPAEAGGRTLVAHDYSTGAFLTCAGKPNPPPKGMLDALVSGEVAST